MSAKPIELSRLPLLVGKVLIFESTFSGSVVQKATTLSLSAFLWALWLSLWVPLLTGIGWALGPIWGFSVVMGGHGESLPTIALLTAGGLALAMLLVLGGAVQWGFGTTRSRPEPTSSVTLEELALAHNLAPATLTKIWDARRIVMHHAPDGRLIGADIGETAG